MTNQETTVANWFSTTLSSSVTNSALTFPVDSIGSLSSPAYIVINPDNAAKREVVLADGTWGASSFVASSIADRGLAGSASGAQAHDSGTVVEVRPLAQHIEDINDRVDAHAHGGGSDGAQVDHGGLGGLGDDDHTQYSLADGTRAFTGEVAGVTPTASASLATKAYIDTRSPVGAITMYGSTSIPTGWLECDGTAVSRTTYADLFAVVGTTFGAGDGSTTFNLPDLTGKFPVGALAGGDYNLGDTGGEETHVLTSAEMPSHTHLVDPPSTSTTSDSHSHAVSSSGGHSHGVYDEGATGTSVAATNLTNRSGTTRLVNGDGAHSHTTDSDNHSHSVDIAAFNSASTGSGAAHENRPPFLALTFIIKT